MISIAFWTSILSFKPVARRCCFLILFGEILTIALMFVYVQRSKVMAEIRLATTSTTHQIELDVSIARTARRGMPIKLSVILRNNSNAALEWSKMAHYPGCKIYVSSSSYDTIAFTEKGKGELQDDNFIDDFGRRTYTLRPGASNAMQFDLDELFKLVPGDYVVVVTSKVQQLGVEFDICAEGIEFAITE